MMTYIGIVEHNENEGEDFGYYITNTPENVQHLKDVMTAYDSTEFGADNLTLELDGYTEQELNLIEKGANNLYMARVNYINENETDWVQLIAAIVNDEDPFYKGDGLVLK